MNEDELAEIIAKQALMIVDLHNKINDFERRMRVIRCVLLKVKDGGDPEYSLGKMHPFNCIGDQVNQ